MDFWLISFKVKVRDTAISSLERAIILQNQNFGAYSIYRY